MQSPFIQQHRSSSQRRMAAQIHLDRRGEPAKVEIIAARNRKGRFSQIVVRRNALQHGVRQPGIQRANASRIAAERIRRECRDFVIR